MSTQPVTNPSQVTPSILGQEEYNALVQGYADQNAGAEAQAAPGQAVPILVPSLTAIQVVQALAAAGMTPTPAMYAAQVTVQMVVPNPAATAPPPYSLGAAIGSGSYVLQASGAYPAAGDKIQIGGQIYLVEWLNMFNMKATLVRS